ncbi:MAG: acetolactate synthase small subunit [Cytophagales bacterium]|nr:acetolactate synthase small subunit [Bernardetiaceae bacterium]MDW8210502.1 acetolactate synthase small subunit [Cytophagales bacterium]
MQPLEGNQQRYTISIFTEDKVGLLSRITAIFTRRKINIDSLTVSETENRGISRFTVVIRTTPDRIGVIVRQIEKQVEVLKAFYYTDDQVVYQELALYKLPTEVFASSKAVEKILRDNHARVITIEPEFIVIEKTGHEEETTKLFNELKPYGVLSFVRSGRIAIAKPMKLLKVHLQELENISVF